MPHIHDQYDFTVTIYIIHDGKLLLVNHPRYGMWLPVGGHIELDEDPDHALLREIQEETGLKTEILSKRADFVSEGVKPLLQPHYIDVHDANPPHKHIGLIYFARALNNKFSKSSEHSDMRWVSSDEFDSPDYNLTEAIKFYGKKAIEHEKQS